MGSQFVDINADGHLDYLTATFDGSPHVSYGSEKGFGEPVRLKDAQGKRILISSIWNYESKKHDGSLPIVGVNTFIDPDGDTAQPTPELARSTEEEKQSQIRRLRGFQSRNQEESEQALQRLRDAAVKGENLFQELMHAVRYCSLGQITDTFFEVGGQYRRNM